MQHKILVLGGTGLARKAANALVARAQQVISSLAGVTRNPHLPRGEIRMGGFGGIDGLVSYTSHEKFDWIVDATHPFAPQMSAHAHAACTRLGVKLIRLEAPAWLPQNGDDWRVVSAVADAAQSLPKNTNVAVTVGRKEIGVFFARSDLSGIARMIEPPEVEVPPHWQVLLERPPFTLKSEIDLLRASKVNFLVSKDAGGARVAKLDAAAELGVPVIMVSRPFKPAVTTVSNVAELLGSLGFEE